MIIYRNNPRQGPAAQPRTESHLPTAPYSDLSTASLQRAPNLKVTAALAAAFCLQNCSPALRKLTLTIFRAHSPAFRVFSSRSYSHRGTDPVVRFQAGYCLLQLLLLLGFFFVLRAHPWRLRSCRSHSRCEDGWRWELWGKSWWRWHQVKRRWAQWCSLWDALPNRRFQTTHFQCF